MKFQSHSCEYQVNCDGIYVKSSRKTGKKWDCLANFGAQIITEILADDGSEIRRQFEIEVQINGQTTHLIVDASEFAGMKWVSEHLGAPAVMFPRILGAQHIATAIQLASRNIRKRQIYGHTGWVSVKDRSVYLHACGAIGLEDSPSLNRIGPACSNLNSPLEQELAVSGPIGPVSDEEGTTELRATLPPSLADFSLPTPRRDVSGLINEALQFLNLGPAPIIFPLFAAIWRAILGQVRFGVHMMGRSGTFKTEIAAIVQQFFGATMDARNLKGTWSSTPNALESLSHVLKDALLVVDDFVPIGGRGEIGRLSAGADRLFRSAGNSAGRARSSSSGSYRPGRYPRALLLSTGEEVPTGYSLRARLLVLQFEADSIDVRALTRCQALARSGEFAGATAAFIAWVSKDYDAIQAELTDAREQWRQDPPRSIHRRIDDMCRELEFGFLQFTLFAVESEVITESRAEELRQLCFEAIWEASQLHQQCVETGDPVEHFCLLLTALFGAKKAHLACWNGNSYPEEHPEAWGYRRQKVFTGRVVSSESSEESDGDEGGEAIETWIAGGVQIGWFDGESVYLNPEICYAQVQALAAQNNAPLTMTLQTLEKRLAERGIVERDERRQRIRRRVTIDGVRRYVLVIPSQRIQWLVHRGPHPNDVEDFEDLLEA